MNLKFPLPIAVDDGKNTFSTDVIRVISEKANIITTTAIVIPQGMPCTLGTRNYCRGLQTEQRV